MYYNIVDNLAGGDITKHNQILDLELIHVLNHLSFLKIKEKYGK